MTPNEATDTADLAIPVGFGRPSRVIRSVCFPLDLSIRGDAAFYHALKIVVCNGSEFDLLHVSKDRGKRKKKKAVFPGIRKTLEQWGLCNRIARERMYFEILESRPRKVRLNKPSPLAASLRFLKREPANLIVLSTEGRSGLIRLLKPSVVEPLARRAKTLALLVPRKSRGFVFSSNGTVSLERVLIPCLEPRHYRAALNSLLHIALPICDAMPRLIALRLSDGGEIPAVELPPQLGMPVEKAIGSGGAVEQILSVARSYSADLIVLTTEGHKRIMDSLRGTVVERVVRRAPCPVLAVPVNQSRVIDIRY